MKVIIGKNPNDDFRVEDDNGVDITEFLEVKSITVTASSSELTAIFLECYGAVEVESDNVTERFVEDDVVTRRRCMAMNEEEWETYIKSIDFDSITDDEKHELRSIEAERDRRPVEGDIGAV